MTFGGRFGKTLLQVAEMQKKREEITGGVTTITKIEQAKGDFFCTQTRAKTRQDINN